MPFTFTAMSLSAHQVTADENGRVDLDLPVDGPTRVTVTPTDEYPSEIAPSSVELQVCGEGKKKR